jgi:hypothetical protein
MAAAIISLRSRAKLAARSDHDIGLYIALIVSSAAASMLSRNALSSRVQEFQSLSSMARKRFDVHSTRIRLRVIERDGSNVISSLEHASAHKATRDPRFLEIHQALTFTYFRVCSIC